MTACTKHWRSACGKAASRVPAPTDRPRPGLPRFSFLALFLLIAATPSVAIPFPASLPQSAGRIHADKGFDHFYNLELDEAVAAYQKAIELEPENPDFWIGLAHARMFQHLRSAGKLDVQIYTASNDLLPHPQPPDPQFERDMWKALERARKLCEKRLAANKQDAEAYYALGMAYAVEANFHINARGKPLDALRPATRAKNHHARVREFDPGNHDVNLVLGTYEYVIGSVPAGFRWVLWLVGYSGSKQRGIELLKDAVLNGKRVAPPAMATMAYVYNREQQYGASRQMLEHLVNFYPRNLVFPMEIGASYAREGNFTAAANAYTEVARKFESGAAGFAQMSAPRLYFQIAVMREYSGDHRQASAEYDKVLSAFESTDGRSSPPKIPAEPLARLRAVVLLRYGSISASLGEKEKARWLLEQAAATPFAEVKRSATERLKKL